ncbi:hypothetical protein ACUXDN_000928 [Staphylococcus hominis]
MLKKLKIALLIVILAEEIRSAIRKTKKIKNKELEKLGIF